MELRALFNALDQTVANCGAILEDWSQTDELRVRNVNYVMTIRKYDIGYRVNVEPTIPGDIRLQEKRFHNSVVARDVKALLRRLPRAEINSAYSRLCESIRIDNATSKAFNKAGHRDVRAFGYANSYALLLILAGLEDNGIIRKFGAHVFDQCNLKVTVHFRGSVDQLAQVFGYKTLKEMRSTFLAVSSGNIWEIELETSTQDRALHMAFYNH